VVPVQVAEVIDDGRSPAAEVPSRTRAARAGALLLLGAAVGLAGGQAWAQRAASADAASQVRLRAVITSAHLEQDLGQGPTVKVVGTLINAGPRRVAAAVVRPATRAHLLAPVLDAAESVTFTLEPAFVCRGPSVAPPPDLALRVRSDDGTERDVAVSLQGDQAWADLSLVCLARAS
jgi:hypothetical protein